MDETSPFLWIGNHPATDLCNTTPVVVGEPVDLLGDAARLSRWLREAGINSDIELEKTPGRAQLSMLDFVHRLRTALRPVLEGDPDPRALDRLNHVVAEQPCVLHVSARSHHAGIVATDPAGQLRLDLATAVLDIFDHDAERVRRCANPDCVLLFLDASKSRRRRWCDMATCGNRAKAAAHYRRQHTSTPLRS